MLDLTTAVQRVTALVAPDVTPTLTAPEIQDAVVQTQTVTTWAPSTAYAAGAQVIPVTPLMRRFICVLPGMSGTMEPPWLIAPAWTGPVNPLAGSWWGMGVLPLIDNVSATPWFWGLADGTAAFRGYGPFVGELYDVRAAAHTCWMLKAQKATSKYDAAIAGGPNARRSQMFDMCMAQARRFAPVGFG